MLLLLAGCSHLDHISTLAPQLYSSLGRFLLPSDSEILRQTTPGLPSYGTNGGRGFLPSRSFHGHGHSLELDRGRTLSLPAVPEGNRIGRRLRERAPKTIYVVRAERGRWCCAVGFYTSALLAGRAKVLHIGRNVEAVRRQI